MTTRYQFDPRALVLSTGILSLIPFVDLSELTLLTGGCGILILGVLVGIRPDRIILRTRKIAWFAATIVVLQSATSAGSVIFGFGGILFTTQGVVRGLELSASLAILLWGSTVLLWSTPSSKLVEAFETWLRPFQIRLHRIVMIINLTMNLVPSLVLRTHHLGLSFRSRGIDIESSFRRRVNFLLSAATPLFASSARAASRLAIAMESRGYDPTVVRSSLVRLRFSPHDWILLTITLAVASAAVLAEA